MRHSIRFLRKGVMVEVENIEPTALLLDYLRETERSTGTKEGCGEGDCGACTVVLGRLRDGKLSYEPVNSCIQLLGQVDGAEVITVEDLVDPTGGLHPVQAAMVENHGSQCGFCTPGFVMSLFALYHASDSKVTRDEVNDAIAGNLCRCTGYRPIVDAGVAVCDGRRRDRFRGAAKDTAGVLSFLADSEDVFIGDEERFFAAPASLDSLADLYERHPTAVIVAGGTDVGLWITKQLRNIPKVIHLGRARGLDRIDDTGFELIVGAAATYAQVEPYFRQIDPDLGELIRRLGSKQVRASGTLCGNTANGSPIGDTPPVMLALAATVELRKGKRVRTVPIDEFFIDYGKQARQPGELVSALIVPRLNDGQIFRCFKVAKRFDQDISSVMGAFRFTVAEDGTISEARLAFGGMASTPKRAKGAEAALEGALLRDSRAWARAFTALREDFSPIDDHRASARYRAETAHALLGKALIEAAGTTSQRTRIIGQREKVADGSR